MSKDRHLDPRAQAAISYLQNHRSIFHGAICSRNLPAVLPKRGDRRRWKDAVTVFLLSELIGVHWVEKGKTAYFRGPLYQINRNELARRFGCKPDDVSASLHWLKALGLVFVDRRTRIDGTGKPCGTEVFAFPLMDRIHLMLDFFTKNGCPMTASELMASNTLEAGLKSASRGSELADKRASSHPERGTYLNCAQTQQKLAAEIGGGTSAKRQTRVVNDDRGSLGVDGGGEADADNGAQTQARSPAGRQAPSAAPPAPMPSAEAHGANNRQPSPSSPSPTRNASSAPPARWTPPELPDDLKPDSKSIEAWRKACLFCQLWAEAIVRLVHINVCKPTPSDHRTAFKLFHPNPQTGAFYSAAVAISAWEVATKEQKPEEGKWDKYFFCHSSFEIKAFIRAFTSGKLQSEIGHAGWKINTFEDLRRAFTESELRFYGFTKIPVLEIDPEVLWEHQPGTPDFYRVRNLPLPPEVVAASEVDDDPSD